MVDYSNLQQILIGKSEPLYTKYKDSNGNLVSPTSPFVRIYNPNGVIVDSGIPTAEETGVYYKSVSLSSSGVLEGVYQAYWEGTISGFLITMDTPQYFYVKKFPWQVTTQDSIVQSIRRMLGDTNPNNYRISVQDMYYFLSDAVDEVQSRLDFGYTLAITSTSITWNKSLYSVPSALFKLRTLIEVMGAILHDDIYDGGSVQVGDIKVDVTGILKLRMENLKRLEEKYEKILYEVKLNSVMGEEIDTYVTGVINNTVNYEIWDLG